MLSQQRRPALVPWVSMGLERPAWIGQSPGHRVVRRYEETPLAEVRVLQHLFQLVGVAEGQARPLGGVERRLLLPVYGPVGQQSRQLLGVVVAQPRIGESGVLQQLGPADEPTELLPSPSPG